MNIPRSDARQGFTFMEVLIVVAVIAILLAALLPALVPRHPTSQRISCVNNLKQLGLAYRTWALDNGGKYPGQVSVTNGGAMEPLGRGDVFFAFLVMSNEISNAKILFCPEDKDPRRKPAVLFNPDRPGLIALQSNTNTSYFAALDAGETNVNAFLSGDRNSALNNAQLASGLRSLTTNDALAWMDTMHHKQGNVGLADGSVQQFSTSKMLAALAETGFQTNRLVFP